MSKREKLKRRERTNYQIHTRWVYASSSVVENSIVEKLFIVSQA